MAHWKGNALVDSQITNHLTSAMLIVYVLKWLRSTKLYQRCVGWLPISNGKIHVIVSGIGAFIAAVGIHGSISGNYSDGWKYAGTIPSLAVMWHMAVDWGTQMAFNQGVFAVAVQEKAAAPVVTVPVSVAPDVTVTAPIPKKDTV